MEETEKKIELSADQAKAVESVMKWAHSDEKTLTLGGYAGTGKTTVIKSVRELLNKGWYVAVCAFTGKAVQVLRNKGIDSAQTAHSLMYNCKDNDGSLVFEKKTNIGVNLVIVDEASMFSKVMDEDLRSYPVKILYVGDPGQLEPVGEDINLMANPDVLLNEIHRQASGSSIIGFANAVRKGRTFRYGKLREDLEVCDSKTFWRRCCEYDQIICGFNATRHEINRAVRREKGYRGEKPLEGEKIICLRNNRELGLFNGMQAKVLSCNRTTPYLYHISMEDDLGMKWVDVPVLVDQFGKDKVAEVKIPRGINIFDFAYAVTCHKSQGSEWDKVAVMEQIHSDWNPARWRYTAATRAAKKLLYCIG